jgi:hypothetical protein
MIVGKFKKGNERRKKNLWKVKNGNFLVENGI